VDDEADPEAASKSGMPVSVIIGIVLVSAALLVLVALSVPLLLQQLGSDPAPPYAVGDCVVQDGTRAVPADCEEPNAFRVVMEVERFEDCPDYPTQPAITVSEPAAVFCVSPVGTGGDLE
jgi:collagen type III alpha